LFHAFFILFSEGFEQFVVGEEELSEHALPDGRFGFGEEGDAYYFVDAEEIPEYAENQHDIGLWGEDGGVGEEGLGSWWELGACQDECGFIHIGFKY
jgi:hypothetical protein